MAVSKLGDKKQKRWIKPAKLSDTEFKDGIIEAEKGPFNTVEKSIENFESWLKNREKK